MIIRIIIAAMLILWGIMNLIVQTELMGWMIWAIPTALGAWIIKGIVGNRIGIKARYNRTLGEKI